MLVLFQKSSPKASPFNSLCDAADIARPKFWLVNNDSGNSETFCAQQSVVEEMREVVMLAAGAGSAKVRIRRAAKVLDMNFGRVYRYYYREVRAVTDEESRKLRAARIRIEGTSP